jgi:uncharacterized membrane protein
MYKIVGADGKEYGPVSVEQLRQWISEGRADAQTRVVAEGETVWNSLGSMAEFAEIFGAASAGQSASAQVMATASHILAQDYSVDFGSCLDRSWTLLKNNMGLLISVFLVYGLIIIAIGLVGMIPIVGILSNVAQIVVGGPLLGGLYWVLIRQARSQPAEVSNLFDGFRRAFGNLILAQLVPGLIALVAMLPGVILTVMGAVIMGIAKQGSHPAAPVAIPLLVIGVLFLVAGLCVMIYLMYCWIFTIPLVMDKQMGFWDAMKLSRGMVRKHWWIIFGFMIVMGLIGAAGMLACCVGALFTMPLAFGAIVCLYEDIFGAAAEQAA